MPESFSVYFPPPTPFVDGLVLVSGVVEILAGLALFGSWRRRQVGIAVRQIVACTTVRPTIRARPKLAG